MMESPSPEQATHWAGSRTALPLSCLNHISRTCADLSKATKFYENLLGFVQIRRPGSLDVDGSWLFNYGIGIHLLQSENRNLTLLQEQKINPKSDHISFQCADMNLIEAKLKENAVTYLRQQVEDGGIWIDQLFFHDPDGFMIEVCNCDQIPVVPLSCVQSHANRQTLFGSSTCERTSSLSTSGAIPMVSS